MADLDPRGIVVELLDYGVDFVLIGAGAAILQGVPLPSTLDLDVTVAASGGNRKRLAAALNALDAKLRLREGDEPVPAPLDEKMLAKTSTVTLSTRFGPFDVVFEPAGAPDYAALRKRSVEVRAYGVVLRVASIEDIVTMKRATGRAKDAAHLTILLDFLREIGEKR